MDVIIPVLNEEDYLRHHSAYFNRLAQHVHLIFVDGGSDDQTVDVARQYGKVLCHHSPRSVQKNFGAAHSESPYILFLNVDCEIDPETMATLPAYLDQYQAGCLQMRITDQGWLFRLYEWLINIRARVFGVVDADLGLCITRALFDRLGQFDVLPIMDDIAFSKKLRRAVRIHPLEQEIHVSSRRWHEQGFLKTLSLYSLAYVQYWSGIRLIRNT